MKICLIQTEPSFFMTYQLIKMTVKNQIAEKVLNCTQVIDYGLGICWHRKSVFIEPAHDIRALRVPIPVVFEIRDMRRG